MGSATYCKLTGLVDYELKVVYALHGVVHIENGKGETVAKAEQFLRLDYDRVTPEA